MDQVPDPATPIPGHDNTADEAAVRTMQHQVALSGLKLNPALADYLQRWQERHERGEDLHDPGLPVHKSYQIRPLRYRLTDSDIEAIVREFKAGTPKHVLAKRHEISLGSVKNILRRRGVRRSSHDETVP